ncbi:P-type conjugative transfer protein TrbL, partial [Acidithiobacillus caldus]|nr:P-type conjugative transfer protein TrbL [Acidithiobacillus caldus]
FILTALAYLVTFSIVPLMTTEMENVANPLQMGFTVLILGAVIALLPKKASSIANSLLYGKSSFSGGELAKEGAGIGAGTVLAGAGLVAGGAALSGAAGGMGAGSLGAAAGAGGTGSGAGSLSAAAGSGLGGAVGDAGMLGGAAGVSDGAPVPAELLKSLVSPDGAAKDGPTDYGAPAPKLEDLPRFRKPQEEGPKPVQSDSGNSGGNNTVAAQGSGGTASGSQDAAPTDPAPASAPAAESSPAGEQAPADSGAPASGAPADNGSPASRPATLDDVVKAIKEGQQQPKKSLGEKIVDYAEKRAVSHVEEHFSGGEKLSIGGDAIHTTHEKD